MKRDLAAYMTYYQMRRRQWCGNSPRSRTRQSLEPVEYRSRTRQSLDSGQHGPKSGDFGYESGDFGYGGWGERELGKPAADD